jgi:hypothetical protein
MPTSRPFAYYVGPPTIAGTKRFGNLSVGVPTSGFTAFPQYWMGPDEDLGYIIAAPVSGNTQPTPISGVTASVQFWRSADFTAQSYLNLVNNVFNQNYTTAEAAARGMIQTYDYYTNYPASPLGLFGSNTTGPTNPGSTFNLATNISMTYNQYRLYIIGWQTTAGLATLQSASIGGQTCDILVQTNATQGVYIGIAIVKIRWSTASATNQTFTVSFNQNIGGINFQAVNFLYVTSDTPYSTATSIKDTSNNVLNLDVQVPTQCYVLMAQVNVASGSPSTWSISPFTPGPTVTEFTDATIATRYTYTSARAQNTSTTTNFGSVQYRVTSNLGTCIAVSATII